MKIAFIDNFDSFTFNLVHYLQKTGAELCVFRNDELHENVINEILQFDAVIVGPGPNSPKDAGNLMDVLRLLVGNSKPILGVCLGHQALGELLGFQLKIAAAPVHGKSSIMRHSGEGIFSGIENPMQIGRYHSLIVAPATSVNSASSGTVPSTTLAQSSVPAVLEIHGTDELGQIMAFSHRTLPIWAVQFHPESVLTPEGQLLLNNWVDTFSSTV